MKKFLKLKFCEPGGCVFSNKLKMARAQNLIDGNFVGFLITVQNFRQFGLV
jgi:hypothetical protein